MRRIVWATLAVAGVVAILVLAGLEIRDWYGTTAPPGPAPTPGFTVRDVTGWLGPTFNHGAPQAFGWNGTSVLATGVVGSPGPETVPYPLLSEIGNLPGTPVPQNRSREVSSLFRGGDTLGIGWNGSSWLITGEASWGTRGTGALAALSGGTWTNLTPRVEPYLFGNGGIWFDGWNGTGWLMGGQSDSAAALLSMKGSDVVDLSSLLPDNGPNLWIQFIAWNGTAWLVGGPGIFGALNGTHYTNLLPASQFTGGGMFAAAWNGSAWLVGGGIPGAIEYLHGTQLSPAPALSHAWTWWVSTIIWDGEGWYIAGRGGTPSDPYIAELGYLGARTDAFVDLSSSLPSSFSAGQIQFGDLAPFQGAHAVLLVGQGGLAPERSNGGPSHGAAAIASRS